MTSSGRYFRCSCMILYTALETSGPSRSGGFIYSQSADFGKTPANAILVLVGSASNQAVAFTPDSGWRNPS